MSWESILKEEDGTTKSVEEVYDYIEEMRRINLLAKKTTEEFRPRRLPIPDVVHDGKFVLNLSEIHFGIAPLILKMEETLRKIEYDIQEKLRRQEESQ